MAMGDDRRPEAAGLAGLVGLTGAVGLDGLDDQDRASALTSLRLALLWSMARERWDDVGHLVESMSTALAGGDAAAFRRAAGDLLVAGPKRVTGVGDTPTEPVPEKIRERLNELIHTLDTPSGDERRRPDDGRAPAPPRRT
jgi:hypothetical protein